MGIAYHTTAVKTAHNFTEKELIVGDTGPGTGTHSYPKALNDIMGMKFKLVRGYPSSVGRLSLRPACRQIDCIGCVRLSMPR